MMPNYKIYVRDRYLNRIGEIDDFNSLVMIPRFNAIGSWSIDLSYEVASALGFTFGTGIIIMRDGDTILSGPVRGMDRKWDASGDVVTVFGPDDMTYLNERLAYPVYNGPPYTSQAYDVQTGAAETVMRHYVDVNAGPGAVTQRQVYGLTQDTDQGRGSTITGRARFDSVLGLLQTLALAGGDLGFRIVQIDNNLQFQVYIPTDKTATAIFSPMLGNLRSFGYAEDAAEANYVVAGGSGTGVNRIFVESGDSQSITDFGRIEEFFDQRNTSVTDELSQAVATELANKAHKTNLSLTPVDTNAIAFGRDYSLGDKVSVVLINARGLEDNVVQDVVREVQINLSTDQGEVITPTIGTPGTTSRMVLKMFRDLRKLARRISNVERV